MKKSSSIYLTLLIGLLTGSLWFFIPQDSGSYLPAPPEPAPIEDISFLQQPSATGTTDDPDARQQWELDMLRDPKTGRIPENMRQRELRFTANIPDVKSRSSVYRQAGLRDTPWLPAGPVNVSGRTRAVELDVTNENIILAGGVSGGMWRSENAGNSWVKTTPPDVIQSVTCLAQDTRPGKTNVWYYGTGELIGNSARGGDAPYRGDGIFKSFDGGRSWSLLPSTSTNNPQFFDSPFNFIFNVKLDVSNLQDDELYAACVGGIFRSPDGGSSWQATLADTAALFTDVEVSASGVVYASMSAEKFVNAPGISGVFRSADGINWQNITPAGWPEEYGRTVIDVNPRNENEVYFLVQSDNGDRLWRYQHAAPLGQWTDLSANLPDFGGETGTLNLQGSYNMVVKAHPGQDNVLFLGGTNLYRSTDAFNSRDNIAWIGGYDTTGTFAWYPNQHPDQHALLFYPSDPNKSIAGHDGGLSFTNNILAEDVSWEDDLSNGYKTSQFYTIGLDQSQVNDIIIGGLQDNGSQITPDGDPGSPWNRILGGDGGYTHVAFKGSFYYVSFQKSQIYRLTLSEDLRLTSFARVDPLGAGQVEEQEFLFINPYVIDPNNNNRMYLAAGNVVYRNNNLSQIEAGSQEPTSLNWDILPETAVDSGSISAISVSYLPGNVLYYGTNRGDIFRADSVDSARIQVRQLRSSLFPRGGYNAHIAISPVNAEEILVIFSNYNTRSILHSTDGGRTFTDVGGNLEETREGRGDGPSVRYAEIIPLQSGQNLVLVGTSTGVYSTLMLDGANTEWVQEGPETIGDMVAPQMRYRSLDGRVVVATHGNGVFFKDFDNVLPVDRFSLGKPLNLGNPYPNPTRGDIRIPFTIPETDNVRIRIYNMQGQVVRTVLWAIQNAGSSLISWDGKDQRGAFCTGGVYIIQLEFQDQVMSKRIVLVR